MVLTRKTEGSIRQHLPKITLVSYIVLSALFILWTMFSMLKVGVYQAGFNNAILQVANQSVLEGACERGVPLSVGNGQSVTLINVSCLQQAAPTTGTSEAPAK